MYKVRNLRGKAERLSLGGERLRHVHGGGRHRPPLLVVLQQPVQLLQVSHDVVLDVGCRDLEPHAAAVKGAREVPGKHFVDHPGHNGNDLLEKKSAALAQGSGRIFPPFCGNPLPWVQGVVSTGT